MAMTTIQKLICLIVRVHIINYRHATYLFDDLIIIRTSLKQFCEREKICMISSFNLATPITVTVLTV